MERVRIVIFGDAEVGKSSVIKRFLQQTFSEKYRRTIEDLYSRDFCLDTACDTIALLNGSSGTHYGNGDLKIKVEILDTAGDLQFPAMKRLSIANANAFLLVYSITSHASFTYLQSIYEEIREQRSDFQTIPIVVAGNKFDLAACDQRQVCSDLVAQWISAEFQKNKVKFLECSAKTNHNVKEIFRSFLILSPFWNSKKLETSDSLPDEDELKKWKRRSSSYLSCISTTANKFKSAQEKRNNKVVDSATSSSNETAAMPSASGSHEYGGSATVAAMQPKSKPRSRSLIRRSSQKQKQQHLNNSLDDCNVS